MKWFFFLYNIYFIIFQDNNNIAKWKVKKAKYTNTLYINGKVIKPNEKLHIIYIVYNLSKPVVLQVDASEGLGGALLQPNENDKLQPVAFTSCSLNETEQRYSQIEKECLAICNCFHKFDQWLYGKSDIMVHTDHQPLETILKKPLNKAPARLQKMLMRLQRYRFTTTYRKGTSLHLADALSRAPLPTPVGVKVTGMLKNPLKKSWIQTAVWITLIIKSVLPNPISDIFWKFHQNLSGNFELCC